MSSELKNQSLGYIVANLNALHQLTRVPTSTGFTSRLFEQREPRIEVDLNEHTNPVRGELHAHNEYVEIISVVKGSFLDRGIEIEEGSVVVRQKGEVHQLISSEDVTLLVIKVY